MSSLQNAKKEVISENPDLSMPLRFEVSPKEIIEKLLAIEDLTLPVKKGEV